APAGQPAAWAELRRFRGRGAAARFLLRGVTGSGKTEVYLQAIARCLEPGREAIVLVPEISLTPQMVDRFKGRFGDRVAVLHSRLSQGERYGGWGEMHRGQACGAVGARAGACAPCPELGVLARPEERQATWPPEGSA